MSGTCPASGASNPIPRFAKSDDGTSSQGRRASRENTSASVGRRPLVIGGAMSGPRQLEE